MAGGDKKIHEHPNAGIANFKVNPQNAGRKKRKFKQHLEDLKAMGYSIPTRDEYYKMIGYIIAMEEADLQEFSKDQSRPYWIRLIVIDLNNKNTRQRMMADFRDWMYGKAEQKVEIENIGDTVNLDNVPDYILEALLKSIRPSDE